MRETLHQVKRASENAHQEHANLIQENEARIESTMKSKQDLDLRTFGL